MQVYYSLRKLKGVPLKRSKKQKKTEKALREGKGTWRFFCVEKSLLKCF